MDCATGNMARSARSGLVVEAQNPSGWADGRSAAHRKTLETSSCRVWREKQHFRSRHGARYAWQAMRRERLTACSWVIISELVGHCSSQSVIAERHESSADQQWDKDHTRKCREVPWMPRGEEPEVRVPPVPSVVTTDLEAPLRTPHVRRRYTVKQDVVRHGRRDVRLAQLWQEERRE